MSCPVSPKKPLVSKITCDVAHFTTSNYGTSQVITLQFYVNLLLFSVGKDAIISMFDQNKLTLYIQSHKMSPEVIMIKVLFHI